MGSIMKKLLKYKRMAKIGGIIIAIATALVMVISTIFTIFKLIQTFTVFIPVVLELKEPEQEEEEDSTKVELNTYGMDDEYYTKARMIYEIISKDSSKADMLVRQLPPGVEKIIPGYYTPKNILEVYMIFRECLSNETAKTKYKLDSTYYIDIEMLYGTFHRENSYGSCYNKPNCWFTADTIQNTSATYLGAFQMSSAYFKSDTYKLLITSYENSSPSGIIIGTGKNIIKNDLQFNVEQRTNVTTDNKSFFFPDMVATSFYPWMSYMNENKSKINKICKYYGISDSDKHIIFDMLGDGLHRGIGKPQWRLTTNADGSLKDPNTQWQIAYVLELAKSGLYSELANVNIGSAFQDNDKTEMRNFLQKLEDANTCGFNIDWSSKDFNYPGNSANPDYGVSGLLRYIWGSRAVKETQIYIDIWFDTLGLTLDSTSNLKLVETPGELQGFWTDSTGSVLSTSEMKGYADTINRKRSAIMFESAGRADTGADTYTVDRWIKFGDDIGTIHYRQRSPLVEGVLSCTSTPANWRSSSMMSATFCGGFSLSMSMSTILHRYINPAEISIAANTYNSRHNTNISFFAGSTGGVFTRQGIKALVEEQRYNGKPLLKCIEIPNLNTVRESDIVNYLNNDAMIIIDTGARGKQLTNGGHYVVIREAVKNSDGSNSFYLANSTSYIDFGNQSSPNYAWKWKDILGIIGGGGGSENIGSVIMPGEGYAEYISNIDSTKSNSTSSSNIILNNYNSIITELINSQVTFGTKYKLTISNKEIKVNSVQVVCETINVALNKNLSYTKVSDFSNLSKQGFHKVTDYKSLVTGDIVVLNGTSKGVGIVNADGKLFFLQNSYLKDAETTSGYKISLFKESFKEAWRLK